MATGSVPITAGSGTEVATHTIAEDGKTKHLQRFVPSTSAGAEISPATAAKQDAAAALVGAVNEAAPGSDTGVSGLNGRLQRLAQRLTSLIILFPASIGAKARGASLSVALADEDRAALDAVAEAVSAPDYEVIAPSDTDEMAGGSGAVGDVLYQLLVIPLTTSPGEVSIEDGSTNTVVFAGGTDSVATLIPFTIDLGGIKSVSGGWEITTGANVRVVAIGRFT